MNPEEILDSLESHLDKYEEIELILLKGHLILEQAINEQLSIHIADKKKLSALNLMFNKKIDLLVALEDRDPISFTASVSHLKEINRIRNKLAHQLDFQDYHKDLKTWACAVLGYTPKTIDRKRTYRNMVRKAFYFLAGVLIGNSEAKKGMAGEKI